MAKKKRKKKKEKKYLGKNEFIFNFFSLVILIGIGVYFGYRSLYYYSKQNQKIEQEAATLSGMIIQNNSPTTGSNVGLHKDSSGYFYKGNVQAFRLQSSCPWSEVRTMLQLSRSPLALSASSRS